MRKQHKNRREFSCQYLYTLPLSIGGGSRVGSGRWILLVGRASLVTYYAVAVHQYESNLQARRCELRHSKNVPVGFWQDKDFYFFWRSVAHWGIQLAIGGLTRLNSWNEAEVPLLDTSPGTTPTRYGPCKQAMYSPQTNRHATGAHLANSRAR